MTVGVCEPWEPYPRPGEPNWVRWSSSELGTYGLGSVELDVVPGEVWARCLDPQATAWMPEEVDDLDDGEGPFTVRIEMAFVNGPFREGDEGVEDAKRAVDLALVETGHRLKMTFKEAKDFVFQAHGDTLTRLAEDD